MTDAATSGADDNRARALAHLQNIAARALSTNVRRVSELERALRMMGRGELSAGDRQQAADTAHQLVGSAGTFGYERVSDAARRLEHLLLSEASGDELSVQAAIGELRQIERDLASGPDEDFGSD